MRHIFLTATLVATLTGSTLARAEPLETPEQRQAAEAAATRINERYGYNGNLFHDLRVWIAGPVKTTPHTD